MTISGYPIWDLANKHTFIHDGLSALETIVSQTRNKQLTVAVGFIDSKSDSSKKSYNAIAVIHNGKILHRQYKTLLPTYDVFLERIFFEPAESHHLFDLQGIPIGTSICEDIWDDDYPIKPAAIYAQQGAKILINISASPYHRHVSEVRNALIKRKAKEHGLWL